MHDINKDWCIEHSTWYADDTLFQAVFHSPEHMRQILQSIAKALHVLQQLGITISESKYAVILALRGTQAKKIRAKLLDKVGGKESLVFQYGQHR